MFGRAVPQRLAHQREAPSGRTQRRDSLEQCPLTKVKGGVRGGRAHARGAILARRGSEHGENTPIRRKSSLFAGRRWKRISADSSATCGSLQPPRRAEPVTRVFERLRRGGALALGRVLHSRAPGPRGAISVAPHARLVTMSRGVASKIAALRKGRAASGRLLRGTTRRGLRSLSVGRGSNARSSVLARRKRCRSRQAAPGQEKRGIGHF